MTTSKISKTSTAGLLWCVRMSVCSRSRADEISFALVYVSLFLTDRALEQGHGWYSPWYAAKPLGLIQSDHLFVDSTPAVLATWDFFAEK
jgi:hypothetical protein